VSQISVLNKWQSLFTNIQLIVYCSKLNYCSINLNICFPTIFIGLDRDMSPDELEEKARLITQVLELQNTLDGKYFLYRKIHCIGKN